MVGSQFIAYYISGTNSEEVRSGYIEETLGKRKAGSPGYVLEVVCCVVIVSDCLLMERWRRSASSQQHATLGWRGRGGGGRGVKMVFQYMKH